MDWFAGTEFRRPLRTASMKLRRGIATNLSKV